MTNRIDQLFTNKKGGILSVYFTAGFPQLEDTVTIIRSLQDAGCDMIEIGIPFSDPLADGPVIQHSGSIALSHGMNLKTLLSQLKDIRQTISIPLLLMGYLNPIMQYGFDDFCREAEAIGIDGLIIPDLPPDIYDKQYKTLFQKHNLHNIMLVTPRTEETRIREIAAAGGGFIYAVATSSTTGSSTPDTYAQSDYFKQLRDMQLQLPVMAGFGISDHDRFMQVCSYIPGGIIGSAFIKHIDKHRDLHTSIPSFIQSILYDHPTGN
jgi:tryptophan synthase alpha chain